MLSRLAFNWIWPLIWKGYKNPLEQKKLYDLNEGDHCYTVHEKFSYYWEKAVERAKKR